MSDIKISALPGASTLTGAETIPLVQGGTTKKVTTDQFLIKDGSGNVGVGTASTDARLTVEDAYAVISARSTTGSKRVVMGSDVFTDAFVGSTSAHNLSLIAGGNVGAVLTTSGNLGLGVTPSAWNSDYKAIQLGQQGAIYGRTGMTENMGLMRNAYRAVDGAFKYVVDGTAARYEISNGSYYWYTAPSGTAGNPISFTQAMTLDASGDLTTANDRINLITVGRGGGGVASNTASGYAALYSNTTGYYNTASGLNALYSNTTGYSNTASGLNALYYNTTGASNTASGHAALYYNTTGASNTASGYAALYYNTTGYYNTASGLNSGFNSDNDIAQYRITTDFDMTLVGHGATKDNAGQLWNSTAIGARAKVTKSNQVVLGDSNVTETLINGDLVQKVSTTAATLTANGTLTFSIVNDTTLRISVRGSDGTTRTATVALS